MADDWDTDPDFVNDLTEKQKRYGSKAIHQSAINMEALREEVKDADKVNKLKTAPKPSFGYGGKFGVEKDRMDKSAVGHDYQSKAQKHASQKDYATGFGGKYGIQTDRQDKSAVGWGHVEPTEKHASQKDYSAGFGGKYGVQTDRQDESAAGWDYKAPVVPHSSQTDASRGFGGKYGVEEDRVDASAAGWNDSSTQDYTLHPSQQRSAVPQSTGQLTDLRSKFENPAASAVPSTGLTAAQQRVMEEKANWTVEKDASAVMEPPTVTDDEHQSFGDFPTPTEFDWTSTQPQMQELESEPQPIDSQDSETLYTFTAAYDYTAGADDELSFQAGDVITNVKKVDVGWWLGHLNDRVGLFPSNYVTQ